MMERQFLEMPIFSRASVRLARGRRAQPVLMCTKHLRELSLVASSDIIPLVAPPSAPPNLADFGISRSGLVRRARKNNGDAFEIRDLRQCETLPLEALVEVIVSERDHPYSPQLDTSSRDLSFVLPGSGADAPSGQGAAWLHGLLAVEGQIFVPTVPPMRAVSLDQEKGQLIVAIACSPDSSPSLRFPTLHMPLTTDDGILEDIAARLGMELRLDVGQLKTSSFPETDYWMLTTLADLYRYINRKGCAAWPSSLPFDTLVQTHDQVIRAEPAAPPLLWLGDFLDAASERFGRLHRYIEGLQRLILARYQALGETLPAMPSDVLIDLRL